MVAVLIAILLFLSPVMPGFTAVSSDLFHAEISAVEIAHEDCDDSKPHTAPGQCCALQCLVFVAQAAPTEVRHVQSFVDVAYRQRDDHLVGIIFPPSLGPPRAAA
ncbi:hypothetical protein [Rhizobium mesoamericanum]|uniref:DUF2946 domain-containing protein n=1 Tax=Rhizobium mesoamericanum STM3625 TaxID=1211777 RepID=K0PZD2_9HYPH|nr:hypothetical protein [Rhizobium mesoamericanum]CCM76872.1 exported hypothetical protein [Rhizobium mesoamericanum STM3625]